MSFSKLALVAGASFVSSVAAHGYVQAIMAEGTWYTGYSPSFQYDSVAPIVAGWSIPEDLSNGFIAPDAYATGDIICHLNATNAQGYVNVTAGDDVTLGWTPWPSSHHGPVLDYLAACAGNDCTTVDKTTLEFFKIDAGGLVDDTTVPGVWATDNLIANNNSWVVNIPSTLAPGGYVLRHEIIALHSAEESDGAQNYPQCINLWVSGTGTAVPASSDSTLGEALYTETDPGILVDIYSSLAAYTMPGPTQWASATVTALLSSYSESPTGGAAATAAATSVASAVSSAVATSSAVASSSVAPASVASSSAVAVTSANVAVATSSVVASSVVSSSKSKKVCSTFSTVVSSAAVAVAATTTTAPDGSLVTDMVTVTDWISDIITQTVTATVV